jgi:hypothetical protein
VREGAQGVRANAGSYVQQQQQQQQHQQTEGKQERKAPVAERKASAAPPCTPRYGKKGTGSAAERSRWTSRAP